MDYGLEFQLRDMTWSFANQGRRFQIWHVRLEILTPDPISPKFPNFAIQILLFRLKHTVAVVTHAHVLQNFYTTWLRGVACQRQRLGPKLEGGCTRGASKKFGNPYIFLQPLEASNFTFGTQIGFGTSLPKNDIYYQNWRGSGPGEHPKKNLGPPTYFCNRWS